MNSAEPISYYALIVDFQAPVNQRFSVFTLARSQISNFYEKKTVPDYFWKFELLFRKYCDLQFLESALKEKGTITFNNGPGSLYTNPWNPNQHQFLAMTKNQENMDVLLSKLQLKHKKLNWVDIMP